MRCWWAFTKPGVTTAPGPPRLGTPGWRPGSSPGRHGEDRPVRHQHGGVRPATVRASSIVSTTVAGHEELRDRVDGGGSVGARSALDGQTVRPWATADPRVSRTDLLFDHPALRRYWYAVARSADLAREAARRQLLGRDTSSGGRRGGRRRRADRCPHREAPLSLGRLVEGGLVCRVPRLALRPRRPLRPRAVGRRRVPVPPKAHLATVHAAERYGLVWLCLGEPAAGDPGDRLGRRPPLPPPQHRRRALARLGDPDDGQLPRHVPLPVRPHRHLRPGEEPTFPTSSSAPSTRATTGTSTRSRSNNDASRRRTSGLAAKVLHGA